MLWAILLAVLLVAIFGGLFITKFLWFLLLIAALVAVIALFDRRSI